VARVARIFHASIDAASVSTILSVDQNDTTLPDGILELKQVRWIRTVVDDDNFALMLHDCSQMF
jgi:hypothetical protein